MTASKSDIAQFGHWQSLHVLEQLFWDITNNNTVVKKRQSGQYIKKNIKKIRDEVMPIIALSKELTGASQAWDQKLEIKCNVTDEKTRKDEEFDARIRWKSFQSGLTTDLSPQFIEVTRCQICVRTEKKEEEELARGEIPEQIIRDTEGWREMHRKAQERICSKITKKYPPETILVLYFDGPEAHNAIYWLKENKADLETLTSLAKKKFSHLFMWGPSAGRYFIDLRTVS